MSAAIKKFPLTYTELRKLAGNELIRFSAKMKHMQIL